MKKAVSLLMSLILILSVIHISLPVAISAHTEGTRKADPSTLDGWKHFFGEDIIHTGFSGTVWSDKTVLSDPSVLGNNITLSEDDNFSVVLSAIASDTFISGYEHDPVDVMLVIDSSSCNEEAANLVTSVNNAISRIQNINKNNRVGVVAYSGNYTAQEKADISDSKVLLPIDRYTHAEGIFFVREDASVSVNGSDLFVNRVKVNTGVVGSKGNKVETDSVLIYGASYIQGGVYTAMNEFLCVDDTSIPEGALQSGRERIPVMVVISSGAPNVATSDYTSVGESNMGDGSTPVNELESAIPFVTQLTVSYAKERISEHYGKNAALYTLSLDKGSHPVVNPLSSGTNINKHWNTYNLTPSDVTMQLGTGRSWVGTSDDGYWQTHHVSIDKCGYDLVQNYVSAYLRADISVEDAFNTLIAEIDGRSMYYPTYVEGDDHDLGGYIEFIDDIGKYMEVKQINGIKLGGVLYTGESMAKNFRPGGGDLGSIDHPNVLGNELIYSVMERLGVNDVGVARDLITQAYRTGQLRYDTATGDYSNYIGWYADADGAFISHGFDGDKDIPDNAVFYNRSYGFLGAVADGYRATDMMYVSVQVHTRIATGTSAVIFRVPAVLIPVIKYNVSITGESLEEPGDIHLSYDNKMDVDTDGDGVFDSTLPTEPIRLVYEVGLDDDIDEITVHEKVAKDYKYNNDGTYTFYTNRWNTEDMDHVHPSVAENTVSYFTPSIENERYYYTENTPIYIKSGSEYIKYVGDDAPIYESGKYFRAFNVFEYSEAAVGGNAIIHTHYEEVAQKSLQKAACSSEGEWYIPRGTIRRFYTEYSASKKDNATATLEYSHYPRVEAIEGEDGNTKEYYVDFILGNNASYSIKSATGIKLTCIGDDTMADHNGIYSFEITGKDGNYRQVRYGDNGEKISSPLTITDGKATVSMLKGEDVYIVDLPAGESFNIREITDLTEYEPVSVNGVAGDNADVTVKANDIATVEFFNSLKSPVGSASLILRPVVHHPFDGPYTGGTAFSFDIRCYNGNELTAYRSVVLEDMKSERIDNIPMGTRIVIRQVDMAEGFSTDKENNTVTLEIGEEKVYAVSFINTYSPASLTNAPVKVTGDTVFEGREEDKWLDTDKFTITLQKKVGIQWVDMGSQITTCDDREFDFSELMKNEVYDRAGTYSYRIVEAYSENPHEGISYDKNICWFDVVIADPDWDGKYEVDSVVGFNGAIVAKDSQGYGVFASFINTYTVSGTDTVSIEIRAQLQDLSGASVAKTPSELTFGLYQADKLLHTFPVTSAAGETYLNLNFGSLNVGKSIEYTVKQILPEAKVSGMQYSEAAYPVTISVYDDTKGGVYALISSDKMSGESVTLEFVNIYDPEDCIWAPEGMVELDGAELSGSEFEFVLCSADESFTKLTEITRSENIGSHISFGDVTFDRVGRYCFVIMQLDLGADGYTYDDTAYEIVVDVTDNNGVLVYDIEETDIRFANSYNKPADNTKPGESQNNTAKPGVQKPATSPQTDDKADFALWYTMLVISGLGFACLVLTSVRRNRR